jgi:hypothetical protein
MNNALALRPDHTLTPNLDDETINILYQKHIIDSMSGIRAYFFLHALLKKAKRQLNEHMPTPPDIEQATSNRSFGANLERYYLQLSTIGVTFEDKTQSRFFISALQQKCIDVDRFVDHLENLAGADPLPDKSTLTGLILRIKDIHSLQNSSVAVINNVSHDTQIIDTSTPRCPYPPRQHNNDLQTQNSDQRPANQFRTRTNTQCICGRWGHSVENCQQLEMYFLISRYLQEEKHAISAGQISESWRISNEKYLRSARSTVRAIRA